MHWKGVQTYYKRSNRPVTCKQRPDIETACPSSTISSTMSTTISDNASRATTSRSGPAEMQAQKEISKKEEGAVTRRVTRTEIPDSDIDEEEEEVVMRRVTRVVVPDSDEDNEITETDELPAPKQRRGNKSAARSSGEDGFGLLAQTSGGENKSEYLPASKRRRGGELEDDQLPALKKRRGDKSAARSSGDEYSGTVAQASGGERQSKRLSTRKTRSSSALEVKPSSSKDHVQATPASDQDEDDEDGGVSLDAYVQVDDEADDEDFAPDEEGNAIVQLLAGTRYEYLEHAVDENASVALFDESEDSEPVRPTTRTTRSRKTKSESVVKTTLSDESDDSDSVRPYDRTTRSRKTKGAKGNSGKQKSTKSRAKPIFRERVAPGTQNTWRATEWTAVNLGQPTLDPMPNRNDLAVFERDMKELIRNRCEQARVAVTEDFPFKQSIARALNKLGAEKVWQLIETYVRPERRQVLGKVVLDKDDIVNMSRPTDEELNQFGVYLGCVFDSSYEGRYTGSGTASCGQPGVGQRLWGYEKAKRNADASEEGLLADLPRQLKQALRKGTNWHIRIIASFPLETPAIEVVIVEGLMVDFLDTLTDVCPPPDASSYVFQRPAYVKASKTARPATRRAKAHDKLNGASPFGQGYKEPVAPVQAYRKQGFQGLPLWLADVLESQDFTCLVCESVHDRAMTLATHWQHVASRPSLAALLPAGAVMDNRCAVAWNSEAGVRAELNDDSQYAVQFLESRPLQVNGAMPHGEKQAAIEKQGGVCPCCRKDIGSDLLDWRPNRLQTIGDSKVICYDCAHSWNNSVMMSNGEASFLALRRGERRSKLAEMVHQKTVLLEEQGYTCPCCTRAITDTSHKAWELNKLKTIAGAYVCVACASQCRINAEMSEVDLIAECRRVATAPKGSAKAAEVKLLGGVCPCCKRSVGTALKDWRPNSLLSEALPDIGHLCKKCLDSYEYLAKKANAKGDKKPDEAAFVEGRRTK